MSKARDLGNLLGGGGAGVPSFSGTGAIDVPAGTTAQRPANPNTGYIRFNTTLDQLEQYTSDTGWQGISAPPSVSSTDVTNVDETATTQTIVITGQNFDSTAAAVLVDNSSSIRTPTTSVRDSSTQITITYSGGDVLTSSVPEPLGVKVINGSGLTFTLEGQISVDAAPLWSTTAGTLATLADVATGTHATLSASDPEGSSISYSVVSGALPAALVLNSSSGAISGDPTNVASTTQSNFTIAASDGTGNSVNRSFSIIVNPSLDGSTSSRAATSASNILSLLGSAPNGSYYLSIGGATYQAYVDFNTFSGGPYVLVMVLSSTSSYGYTNAVWTNTSGGVTTALNPASNSDQLSSLFYNLSSTRTGLSLYQNSSSYFNYLNHSSLTARSLANGGGGGLTAVNGTTTLSAANAAVTNGQNTLPGGWYNATLAAGAPNAPGATYYRVGWKHRDPPEPAGFGYVRLGWSADLDASDSQDRALGIGLRNAGSGPVGSFDAGAGWFNYQGGTATSNTTGRVQGWLYMKN